MQAFKSQRKARRSVLFVPAINLRALAKAKTLDADVLIFDLEDSVSADEKTTARGNLTELLSNHDFKQEILVRINAPTSPHINDDLDWLSSIAHIDGIVISKIRNAQQFACLQASLSRLSVSLRYWLMIETVDAVLNLHELVSMPGLQALIFGAEDLSREMRLSSTPGRLGLLPILSQLVLYARSRRLDVLDSVYTDLENTAGLIQACEQAKSLGFDGKTLIHPNQIAIVNQRFSPTGNEIRNAQKILSAWQQKPTSTSVIRVNGQFIESLHVESAKDTLAWAKKLETQDGLVR